MKNIKYKILNRIVSHVFNRSEKKDYRKIICNYNLSMGKHLDLGSGPIPKNPFNAKEVYGVDIRSYDINPQVKRANLTIDKIPFSDIEFDTISSFDFLEHIPRAICVDGGMEFPFIRLMNEVWRVLKNGGYFFSVTPCFPAKEAFQDPTHINIMTEDTIKLYFCGSAWARIYGYYGSFNLIEEGWRGGKYWALIRKSGDMPIIDLNSPQQA